MAGDQNLNDNSEATREQVQDDAVIGRAFLGSILVFALLGLVAAASYWYLKPRQEEVVEVPTVIVKPEGREKSIVSPPKVKWTDITAASGLDFVHTSGAKGDKLLPETMGSGCAFLDYNNDGHQDILLINCCHWDPAMIASDPTPMKLFRNDGKGSFTDTTEEAGLNVTLYGMGVACGDFDNDGYVDLYVTCLGENRLFRNNNGTFVDVTQSAGVGGDPKSWSSACGWFDFDKDNDLDLLVCNYVEWTREYDSAQEFTLVGTGRRAYGRPQNFRGSFPVLYRNEGNGKFTDISQQAGIKVLNPSATNAPLAKSLGLVFEDFDDDGFVDFFVANDTVQNLLFRNNHDGTFEEQGALVGVAFDSAGLARGAMGVDTADFRNNGSIGVAIGNFANEMSALFVSRTRNMQFYDQAVSSGLGPATRLELTFGVLFLDYDLDGRLDLFQANGHLEDEISMVQASQAYEQSPQLFWNAGVEQSTNEFLKCSETETGPDLHVPMVGRGAAYADIDGDGDLDLLITGCGQKPRLLRNDQELSHNWVRIKLVGRQCSKDAIGSTVILTANDVTQRRTLSPTRSYLSQVELPLTFGLGSAEKVDKLSIVWPDGTSQTVTDLPINQLTVIEQKQTSEQSSK